MSAHGEQACRVRADAYDSGIVLQLQRARGRDAEEVKTAMLVGALPAVSSPVTARRLRYTLVRRTLQLLSTARTCEQHERFTGRSPWSKDPTGVSTELLQVDTAVGWKS